MQATSAKRRPCLRRQLTLRILGSMDGHTTRAGGRQQVSKVTSAAATAHSSLLRRVLPPGQQSEPTLLPGAHHFRDCTQPPQTPSPELLVLGFQELAATMAVRAPQLARLSQPACRERNAPTLQTHQLNTLTLIGELI